MFTFQCLVVETRCNSRIKPNNFLKIENNRSIFDVKSLKYKNLIKYIDCYFFSKTSHLLTLYFINILFINQWLWEKSTQTWENSLYNGIESTFLYERIQLFMAKKFIKKIYRLLSDILVHFRNTFCCYYSKYMRDANWKSP